MCYSRVFGTSDPHVVLPSISALGVAQKLVKSFSEVSALEIPGNFRVGTATNFALAPATDHVPTHKEEDARGGCARRMRCHENAPRGGCDGAGFETTAEHAPHGFHVYDCDL